MERRISCNWYSYLSFDGLYTIELEFINNVTGATLWKIYTGKTYKEAKAKAQSFETRVFNRDSRIHK